jgi:hypothetical protein
MSRAWGLRAEIEAQGGGDPDSDPDPDNANICIGRYSSIFSVRHSTFQCLSYPVPDTKNAKHLLNFFISSFTNSAGSYVTIAGINSPSN